MKIKMEHYMIKDCERYGMPVRMVQVEHHVVNSPGDDQLKLERREL